MSRLFDIASVRSALENASGAGVKVALLDTGIDEDHPKLRDVISASYDVVRSSNGWCCVRAKGSDGVGHGTACAGIISHLAPGVEIHSLKVIGGDARGSSDQFIEGLRWSIANGMNIVNASLGTLDRRARDKISRLADEAFYNGVTIVAAANNSGRTAFPAHLSSVLTVDSAAMDDERSILYRLGTITELEARGIYVEAPAPGGGSKFYTGTSFACPHVTGLAACLLSLDPSLQPFELRAALYRLGRPAQ